MLPAGSLVGLLVLGPLLSVAWLSLRSVMPVFQVDRFVGLANLAHLLQDTRFWKSLGTTLYFAGVAVTLEVLLGLALALLLHRSGYAAHHQRNGGGDVGVEDGERAHAVDPHHGGGGVADHAAGAAGVGRGYDRREVADVDLVPEHGRRDGAADERRRDVVEERGKHEHHDEEQEAALPVVGKEVRQHLGHLAALEVVRKQGEAEQQAEQVCKDHPLVRHVRRQAGKPGAVLEPGKGELVEEDD